jgi:hypothetical protein
MLFALFVCSHQLAFVWQIYTSSSGRFIRQIRFEKKVPYAYLSGESERKVLPN